MSVVPEDPVGINDAETQTRPSSGIARGVAIKVEGLSKRYRIGESQEKYKTLRDTIAGWAKAPLDVQK